MESEYLSTTVADGLRCTACGAVMDPDRCDPSWRWCDSWEHKCPDNPPQYGYFKAEAVGDVAEHFLWEIDDGATWWVIAADEQDALALVIHYANMAGEDCVEMWQDEGWPEPERLTVEQAANRTVYDEIVDERRTMLLDFQLAPSRRMVACSEW